MLKVKVYLWIILKPSIGLVLLQRKVMPKLNFKLVFASEMGMV